jgi:general stress protein 26
MTQATDHESVSIYQFSDEEVAALMTNAGECVLNWGTKDGWPMGVIHSFVWAKGKIWITFASHRHRASAIRRDPRVSVVVSSASNRDPEAGPNGQACCKGRAEFHDDRETLTWMYRQLADKVGQGDQAIADDFYSLLDSPLRTCISVTAEKWITFNSFKSAAHRAGTLDESELSAPLSSDTERMPAEMEKRGINAD